MRSRIRYSIESGVPAEYVEHFEIDPNTAVVRQIRPVQKSQFSKFELVVKAEEEGEDADNRRSATTKLLVRLL